MKPAAIAMMLAVTLFAIVGTYVLWEQTRDEPELTRQERICLVTPSDEWCKQNANR